MTESVVVTPASTPAAGPNDAKLAEKFENRNAQITPPATETPATKPEWVPEKFWDAEKGVVKTEELAKSYGELEKKNSKPATDKKPATAAIEPKKGEAAAEDPAAAVEKAGLNMAEFDAEYQKDGKLSDASYEKLGKAGFDRSTVDTYVAGVEAKSQSLLKSAHDAAGGAEQFAAVQEWAAGNASEADLRAYNDLIASADPAKIAMAVQSITAKFTEANGKPAGRVIGGNGNGGAGGEVYESLEQMKADMKKPEYKKDPAFRKSVEQKLSRSKI